jgi:hypothetical protein
MPQSARGRDGPRFEAGDDRLLLRLGLTVSISQAPELFDVPAGDGNFFPRLNDLIRDLDGTSWWTFAVGVASVLRSAPGRPRSAA